MNYKDKEKIFILPLLIIHIIFLVGGFLFLIVGSLPYVFASIFLAFFALYIATLFNKELKYVSQKCDTKMIAKVKLDERRKVIKDLWEWLFYEAVFMEHLKKLQQKELFDKLKELKDDKHKVK